MSRSLFLEALIKTLGKAQGFSMRWTITDRSVGQSHVLSFSCRLSNSDADCKLEFSRAVARLGIHARSTLEIFNTCFIDLEVCQERSAPNYYLRSYRLPMLKSLASRQLSTAALLGKTCSLSSRHWHRQTRIFAGAAPPAATEQVYINLQSLC